MKIFSYATVALHTSQNPSNMLQTTNNMNYGFQTTVIHQLGFINGYECTIKQKK